MSIQATLPSSTSVSVMTPSITKAESMSKGEAHTNGVESFWALLKRGYYGTYHHMSGKHLQKYIDEFADRTNLRHMDTMDQIKATIEGLVGKRLTYERLTSSC